MAQRRDARPGYGGLSLGLRTRSSVRVALILACIAALVGCGSAQATANRSSNDTSITTATPPSRVHGHVKLPTSGQVMSPLVAK